MKIPVPVKRVVDYNVKVRVKADGWRIDTANVKMSIKPVDEIALAELLGQGLAESAGGTGDQILFLGKALFE